MSEILLRQFIQEAFYSNVRATMDVPNGQPTTDWDADPNEPLYHHDPDSDVALQTDDEQPWERSPHSDLRAHKAD